MMKLNIVLMLLIVVSAICPFAQQGTRYAFVVGVGDYEDNELDIRGPVENAEKVANSLMKVGFSKELLTILKNPTRKEFDTAFEKFWKSVQNHNIRAEEDSKDNSIEESKKTQFVEVVTFFFTGHGVMDSNKKNYLLPRDIKKRYGSYVGTLSNYGINLNEVIDVLRSTGPQFTLIMIEACRVHTTGNAIEKFAPITPPRGVSVMMAADEGQEAIIGFFSNSLIQEMEKPGIEIDQIMDNVKEDVYKISQEKQLPTYLSNKIGKFYFIKEDPLETKMKQEKERIKNKVNELVKLSGLPRVSKAITQKEFDRYALQAEALVKKYKKIENDIGKYEKEYKQKLFYETLENELVKASNYIDRQRTLLERAEMYSNRNSSEPIKKPSEPIKKPSEPIKKPSEPIKNSLASVQIYGLPENIWNTCCVQEDGEYILDMTTSIWKKLSWQDQMKYAKIYQEGYAKAKNLEVRKEIEIGDIRTGWFSKEKVSITLRLIPPGAYLIGSPDNELARGGSELQMRIVIAEGFYLSETEVTQEQWQAIMRNNPSNFTGDSKFPVEGVSWLDARDYCIKLTEKTGKEFRLPLEIEWEYGCRAGTTTAFNIGPNVSSNEINYNGNYSYDNAAKGEYRKKTVHCGSLSNQNAWGLYDMHGNVWEWCIDEFKTYSPIIHHPKDIVISQYKDIKDGSRVFRGGSWNNDARNCRSAHRNYYGVSYRHDYLCFRIFSQR